MEQLQSLQCPDCGRRLEKKSSLTSAPDPGKEPERKIGKAAYKLILFYCYLDGVCGIAGILAYCFGWDKLLYADVAIGILFVLLRFLVKFLGSGSFLWAAAGMAAGFLIFRSLRGICLGISIAFLLRFLYKVILGNFVAALIRAGSKR